MIRLPERPTVSYEPAPGDPDRPFALTIPDDRGPGALCFLSRSDLRGLRNDMDAAEALDREHRMCPDDTHTFRRADAQPLLPPGAVAVVCRHCPANGVLELDATVLPVGGGS